MNKLSYTTILAAAFLLLPGCSDDAAIDNGMMEESPEVLVGDSEVEIKLSSNSSPLTRSGGFYQDEENGMISTISWRRLGVFCLAGNKQMDDAPAYVTDPDWTNKDNREKSDVVLWNAQAKVSNGDIEFTSGTKYYPATNWYCYDFYAYHISNPEIATPALSDDGRQITIAKNIDGQEDVVWGKIGQSELSEEEKASMVHDGTDYSRYAYSARFFRRQMDALSQTVPPTLKLKHILSRFTFSVVVGDEAARGMKVSSIALLDMPHEFDMVLANNTYGLTGDELTTAWEQEGTIPVESINMENKMDFLLKGRRIITDANSEIDEGYSYHAVSMQIPADAAEGTELQFNSETGVYDQELTEGKTLKKYEAPCIMALPGLSEYTLRIALVTADGTSLVCDQPLPFGNADGLMGSETVPAKPGYSYNVKITVYGPQEISLKAELEDWKTDEEMGDISIELN